MTRKALLCGLLGGCSILGAQSVEVDTFTDQVKQVTLMINQNRLLEARPILLKLQSEADEGARPNIDFYIALSYVHEYFERNDSAILAKAESAFLTFIQQYPNHDLIPFARYNLADLSSAQGKFEDALKLYIPLYNYPPAAMDSLEILHKITRIYVTLEKWEAGAPYFKASMQRSKQPEERTTAAAHLLIAQAKMGQLKDVGNILEFFKTPTPVFYTPRFNSALMEIGDQLYDERDFTTSILFYQLVRPYEVLQTGLENYIQSLETLLTRIEGQIKYREWHSESQAKLQTAKSDLKALQDSTNYSPLLSWRIARVYLEMERDWEAFWRFRVMVDQYPSHPQTEHILYSAFSLSIELDLVDQATSLAQRYFKRHEFTQFSPDIVDQLATLYTKHEMWKELFELTAFYLNIRDDDEAAEQLLFKHGFARLERLENAALLADFEGFANAHYNEISGDEIDYFLGLGYLLDQNNTQALERLQSAVGYANSPYKPDATYRIGLALLGLDRIVEARDQIQSFISIYPENPLRAEAEISLGSIEDLMGDYTKALQHFRAVDTFTDQLDLLVSAELKQADILVRIRRSDQAIQQLKTFSETHGHAPASIPIYSKLSEIQIGSGAIREAYLTLKTPLDRFVNLTEVDAISPILLEYLEMDNNLKARSENTKEFFDTLRNDPERLATLIRDRAEQYRYFKDAPPLDPLIEESFTRDNAFREAVLADRSQLDALEAQIIEMDSKLPDESAAEWANSIWEQAMADNNLPLMVRIETAFAHQQVPTAPAPPDRLALWEQAVWPSLDLSSQLWIMNSLKNEFPDKVLEQLQQLLVKHANTDYELEIHKMLADLYRTNNRTDEAISAYADLLKRFSHKKIAAEASLTLADLLYQQGRIDEARHYLESILQRNEWRGQRHADALLMLGRSYALTGNYAEAHGFYERIILGYPSFKETLAWAYYEDIKALLEMEEFSSAETVLNAFQATPGLDETAGAKMIQENIQL